MKTLGQVRSSSWMLFVGLFVSFVSAAHLPVSWGWENGPLEHLQAVIVLAGLAVALVAAVQQRNIKGGAIWCVATLFWLLMLGRETSWGAALLPPLSIHPETGPLYRSSVLWWKPAVAWVCAGMLLLCLCGVVRHRLIQRAALRWWSEGAMPWGALAVFVLAMVLSAAAESDSGPLVLPELSPAKSLPMEEMAECWAYAALWWAQWMLQRHMQGWGASSYLQTMHFSLTERLERRSI